MDKDNFVTGLSIKKSITDFILNNGYYYDLLFKGYQRKLSYHAEPSDVFFLKMHRYIFDNEWEITNIYCEKRETTISRLLIYKFIAPLVLNDISCSFNIRIYDDYMTYKLLSICVSDGNRKKLVQNKIYSIDGCHFVDYTNGFTYDPYYASKMGQDELEKIKTWIVKGFNIIKKHIVTYRGTTIYHVERLFKRDIIEKI